MKISIVLSVFLFLSSCSFFEQQAKIQFDNHKKNVRVLSGNFKISNIFIREIVNTKQADSMFTSIDFENTVNEIDLKKNGIGHHSGQPINKIIEKENLEYTIILNANMDGIKICRAITFRSEDTETKNIFYSNF